MIIGTGLNGSTAILQNLIEWIASLTHLHINIPEELLLPESALAVKHKEVRSLPPMLAAVLVQCPPGRVPGVADLGGIEKSLAGRKAQVFLRIR
jgi:hypothetical protein